MTRWFLSAAAVAAAVAACAAAPAGAAARYHTCRGISVDRQPAGGIDIGIVRAKGLSCARARRVARAYAVGPCSRTQGFYWRLLPGIPIRYLLYRRAMRIYLSRFAGAGLHCVPT